MNTNKYTSLAEDYGFESLFQACGCDWFYELHKKNVYDKSVQKVIHRFRKIQENNKLREIQRDREARKYFYSLA